MAYAPFLPTGIPHYDKVAQAYVGGLFWDGRASDAFAQVKVPLFNPNEMNDREHGRPSPNLLAKKLKSSPSAALFRQTFGATVFSRQPSEICDLVAKAIVAYESSPEVSPFSSKYDAYLAGKAKLTPIELLGLRLTTGTLNGRPDGVPFKKSAHCMDCHAESTDLSKSPDLWTNSCYANLGVPRNPWNLSQIMPSRRVSGSASPGYPDLGLGGFLYLYLGLPPGDFPDGDPLRIDGSFKAPSLRNVDMRPYPGFVKCYMHNGVFKSLKQVVHFYNTRNLTSFPGEVIDFTKPHPYAHLKGTPLWPRPEYLDANTLINPSGTSAGFKIGAPSSAGAMGDLDAEQIGDLRLTDSQENAIVAFLKTLTDGYFNPSAASEAPTK